MAANSSPDGVPRPARPGITTPEKRGRNRADSTVQTFRSPTAVVFWVVWLLFAVANWIDLAVQGRDHLSVVAAAVLLLVTGIVYVTALRPRIIADDAGVTVRNPLRDHRIGWPAVTKVDLADLLRVHYRRGEQDKVISSWAVHYSRRRQLAADVRARRASSPRRSFGLASGARDLSYASPAASPAVGTPEADAEMIVRILSERATAAQAETARARRIEADPGHPGRFEPLTSTWSRTVIVAIIIPALILLLVCLV